MRSTFNVSFYLRGNRLNKKGEATIMISLTMNKDREQFNSKQAIKPDLWDSKSGRAKGKTAEASNLNRLLDGIRSRITTIYNEQINTYGYTTSEKVKNSLLGMGDESRLLIEHFYEKFMEYYKTKVGNDTSETTYNRYLLTKTRFTDFLKSKYNITDINIREVTTLMLEEFFYYLRNDLKLGNNTALKFIQRLNAVFHYVKKSGVTIIDPFVDLSMKKEKEEVGYILHRKK